MRAYKLCLPLIPSQSCFSRPIYATLGLLDSIPASESGTGAFNAVARTSNAPLDLAVYDLPVDADANFAVGSSNGGATLRLPPAFDGNFQLHTVNARSEVQFDAAVQDPSDRGRERRIVKRRIDKNRLVGSVSWDQPDHKLGAREQRLLRSHRTATSDNHAERRRRFRQLFDELEEVRMDVDVQTLPEVQPWDWRDWRPPVHGNHSSTALVVSINGPAVLDLT